MYRTEELVDHQAKRSLNIKVRRRSGKDVMVGIPGALSSSAPIQKAANAKIFGETIKAIGDKPPLLIFCGSQAGTCKSMAEYLEMSASDHFAVTVQVMDRPCMQFRNSGRQTSKKGIAPLARKGEQTSNLLFPSTPYLDYKTTHEYGIMQQQPIIDTKEARQKKDKKKEE